MNRIDFSELYSRFYKRLFYIGYSITKDVHLAEDVVQETFIKAIKKVDMIEEEGKIGAWLSAIATRTAIDFVRKQRNKQPILMEIEMLECLGKELMHNVEEEVETVILTEQVQNAIKKLTLVYQDVLLLKLEKGLKETEIAYLLNLKPSTVKTRLHRARKQLKLLFYHQISA